MSEIERHYHQKRAEQETLRAGEASDPSIARIHLQLAALHRRLLNDVKSPADGFREAASGERHPWRCQ